MKEKEIITCNTKKIPLLYPGENPHSQPMERFISASAYPARQYGIEDGRIGVPVKLGSAGVERMYEIPLSGEELRGLKRSADVVRETVETMELL